jgi:hypothetical protein
VAPRRLPAASHSKIATAPKDSQKPLASSANGSSSRTTNPASASNRAGEVPRPLAAPSAATLNMSAVRRAGTPNPARAA